MIKEIPLKQANEPNVFLKEYESKFKALADEKRLQIMYELTQRGNTCVCDLTEIVDMPQSKLSYHLKILLDAGIITKETRGTWSYYEINQTEVSRILSEQLCCIFKPARNDGSDCC
ncbi:ArsR/SmtB family transcription factor [Paenibacillus oryzisoli]|uniref:Transcriptional regulator n=1 Tax=Paenibacillus oryzisoli TaxID=1850517 RepID=A0A198A4F5_9BACL|nr:metalloregulator ArsR/SmtB family transcription factor [Paenibacillus oryzisoli]OAS15921.1 transcriptional regulator [Paenibacillus oryzisoli]